MTRDRERWRRLLTRAGLPEGIPCAPRREGGLELRWPDGLVVFVTDRRGGAPHYLRTREFLLAYRGSRDLLPGERARLEELRDVLARLEREEPGAAARLPAAGPDDAGAGPSGDGDRRDGDGDSTLVRITAACDQRCTFCNTNEHAPDLALTPDGVARRLEALARAGHRHVTFTGGEPTRVPALVDHLARARRLGLVPSIQTNAVALAEPGAARRLADAGARRLLVSLHAVDDAIADRLTGTHGDLPRTLAGIAAALRAGLEVGTNTVICRDNLAQPLPIVQELHRRFGGAVGEMVFSLMAPVARGRGDRARMARIADVVPHLAPALRRATALGVVAVVPGVCGAPPCALGAAAPYSAELGGPDTGPVAPDRTHLPGCALCVQRPSCSGIWRVYLDQYGGDEFVPLRRPVARVRAGRAEDDG